MPFLLTHPLRGATDYRHRLIICSYISTHTPLAGCNRLAIRLAIFNKDFYSHTPCGVQQLHCQMTKNTDFISTHTPLAGCNSSSNRNEGRSGRFLLTHPLRGATIYTRCIRTLHRISTHTPLAGCNPIFCCDN